MCVGVSVWLGWGGICVAGCTMAQARTHSLQPGVYKTKSLAVTSTVLMGFPVLSIISSRQMYVKFEKENFLPHSLQVIIYWSSHHVIKQGYSK